MSSEVDRTLWVGNLHEKVTEEILYELFLQAGPLQKVNIAKDKDGRPKRFAFITFDHSCSVPYTIQLLNETSLYGNPLRIQCRSGSVHQQQPQQQQQQQQFHMNQNPYQNNSPVGNPFQGNAPAMKPYRSAQPIRSGNFNQYQNSGQQSKMAANPYQNNQPTRGPPQLHKSNTWHGDDLKDMDQGNEDIERDRGRDRSRDSKESDRDRYNSRDRDRSGDRHRHGDSSRDRGRHDDYHSGRSDRNSPLAHSDNYSNGRSSPHESQRDRLLRMQQTSLNAYRQGHNSRSNSGQKPWQSRPYDQRRGRY